ncbi:MULTISPECIES: glutaredoxin family protein [unclassified Methylibium]|uniref:glutaredoxin family protein n=1 Tax=unclassified Methylibium TaxID=2633235 RepID=UPI0003F3F2C3|nr:MULTISPECIES: glutaredoxin family protein [unclassified Methylibium]EWS54570.1 glutaredoxin-like protein, YruB-family [Methylibium sp. T29]EWS58863.1 glutaredoxin-like protein, YruB-family [Methylibium sp. T29-B]
MKRERLKGITWLTLAVLALVAGMMARPAWRAWKDYQDVAATAEVVAKAKAGDIFMYSATYCGYCDVAKRWLAQQKVPYESCEIDRDPVCEQRFRALPAHATPTMVVRGQVQTGFRPALLAQALR